MHKTVEDIQTKIKSYHVWSNKLSKQEREQFANAENKAALNQWSFKFILVSVFTLHSVRCGSLE